MAQARVRAGVQVDGEPRGVPRVSSAQSTGSAEAAEGPPATFAAADARVRPASSTPPARACADAKRWPLMLGSTGMGCHRLPVAADAEVRPTLSTPRFSRCPQLYLKARMDAHPCPPASAQGLP